MLYSSFVNLCLWCTGMGKSYINQHWLVCNCQPWWTVFTPVMPCWQHGCIIRKELSLCRPKGIFSIDLYCKRDDYKQVQSWLFLVWRFYIIKLSWRIENQFKYQWCHHNIQSMGQQGKQLCKYIQWTSQCSYWTEYVWFSVWYVFLIIHLWFTEWEPVHEKSIGGLQW